MSVKTIATGAALALSLFPAAFAQPVPGTPAFDAVSIKLSQPGGRGGGYNPTPTRLNIRNQGLRELVKFAYKLHDYQLTGGPAWQDTERYDIVATYPRPIPDAKLREMLQTMLGERFGLQIHRESREISGFALVVDKNGSKLHAVEPGQHSMMLSRDPKNGERTLTGTSAGMDGLASILAELVARPVEDKTGLTGIFDFAIEWTPDDFDPGIRIPEREGQADSPSVTNGPSLQTALLETLGLRLKTQRAPMEIVVIDHAEKASEN